MLFHYNTSNHLKINTNCPELAATSTNRPEMSISLPRDITECLHLPKLLRISLKSPESVVNSSQIIQNRLEMPYNASNRFASNSTQINPNRLRIAPTRLHSAEFHPKLQQIAFNRLKTSGLHRKRQRLAFNCLAWSQIRHKMPPNRRQTPQKASQTSQNAFKRRLLPRN